MGSRNIRASGPPLPLLVLNHHSNLYEKLPIYCSTQFVNCYSKSSIFILGGGPLARALGMGYRVYLRTVLGVSTYILGCSPLRGGGGGGSARGDRENTKGGGGRMDLLRRYTNQIVMIIMIQSRFFLVFSF